jgi:hypothetical protein
MKDLEGLYDECKVWLDEHGGRSFGDVMWDEVAYYILMEGEERFEKVYLPEKYQILDL